MDSKRNIVTLKLNRMNKEKQHLVDLQSKIDQKSKELKQLRKEYETYFSAICKSWREQTNTMFPNLQPCNIGEYVGVDIIYEGKIYNLFITKEKKKMPELEKVIEDKLIEQLVLGESQWTYREDLKTEEDLWKNFRYILEQNNKARLDGQPLSDAENR